MDPHHMRMRARSKTMVLVLTIHLLLMLTGMASAWTTKDFAYQVHYYRGIAAGNDRFVAIEEDVVVTGAIGSAPRICSLPIGIKPTAVARNHWHFVLVGELIQDPNTGIILASPDGRTWREVYRLEGALRGIAWGNGQWLALGERGVVVGSAELQSWQAIDMREQPNDSLQAAVWATSQWIAVGKGGDDPDTTTAWVVTSSDGYSWATTSRPESSPLTRISWSGEVAVALPGCLWSEDGLTWTGAENCGGHDILWDGNRFITIAVANHTYARVFTSADGRLWRLAADGILPFTSLGWDGSKYLGAGNHCIGESTDLQTWTELPQAMPVWRVYDFENTTYGLAAVGTHIDHRWDPFARPSPDFGLLQDGLTWKWSEVGAMCLASSIAAYGQTLAVACWNEEHILVSGDAESWTVVPLDCASDLCVSQDITSGDHGFVLVTERAWIQNSTDGVNWRKRKIDEFHNLSAIAWTGDVYIAAGVSGIALSEDGEDWIVHRISGFSHTYAMVSNGELIVRVANDGISTSTDGVAWTQRTFDSERGYRDVTWTGSKFVAVGEQGSVATSDDGISWTVAESGFLVELLAVTSFEDVLFIGGSSVISEKNPLDPQPGGQHTEEAHKALRSSGNGRR